MMARTSYDSMFKRASLSPSTRGLTAQVSYKDLDETDQPYHEQSVDNLDQDSAVRHASPSKRINQKLVAQFNQLIYPKDDQTTVMA
jgi:hypothetical protein